MAFTIRSKRWFSSFANSQPLTGPRYGELLRDLDRALRGPVGDDEQARLELEQRTEGAACRASGAEQQDPRRGQVEPQVPRQVGEQARAVRVVADEPLVPPHDRVDGVGDLRAWRQLVDEIGRPPACAAP